MMTDIYNIEDKTAYIQYNVPSCVKTYKLIITLCLHAFLLETYVIQWVQIPGQKTFFHTINLNRYRNYLKSELNFGQYLMTLVFPVF